MKKFALGFILLLVLCSMMVFLPEINVAKAEPKTIVVPDDYLTIGWAIGNASEGDTIYVKKGTYYEHVTVNKSISLIGERRETTIIDGGGYGTVVRIWADSVKVSNFTIRNIGPPSPELPPAMDGILASLFSNGEISNNIIENNGDDGIYLVFSDNNTITGNKISENQYGIRLSSSRNNILASNNVSSNKEHGICLLWDCTYNVLTDNKASENEYGICIDHSSNNTLADNQVLSNNYGIHFYHSPGNIIVGNEVLNNDYGIYLDYSRLNSIYNNNFTNNTCQAYAFNCYNTLDNGYPSGGNYWSDYNGTDLYSGPHQNITGRDGIGDTPYIIDENNQDNYPLMGMFYDFPLIYPSGYDHVTIISNSTVSNFDWGLGLPSGPIFLEFNVDGSDDTVGFCRVMISRALIEGPYTVHVDEEEVEANELPISNSTHAFLYFTYTHPKHRVGIVPEFPTWISMLLMLILLTVATAIYKRRLLKTLTH